MPGQLWSIKNNLGRDVSKQREMEALPPLSGPSRDHARAVARYDAPIDPLLGGVSHITHKASLSIAALYAEPNASHQWRMEEAGEEGLLK